MIWLEVNCAFVGQTESKLTLFEARSQSGLSTVVHTEGTQTHDVGLFTWIHIFLLITIPVSSVLYLGAGKPEMTKFSPAEVQS